MEQKTLQSVDGSLDHPAHASSHATNLPARSSEEAGVQTSETTPFLKFGGGGSGAIFFLSEQHYIVSSAT